MSSDSATETVLPDWIQSLRVLAPFASTLATIAADPETFIREIVAKWFVGGFLDALQYGLGWIVFAYERTRTILLDAIPILSTPIRTMESAVIGLIETMYGAAQSVAYAAGLAGPPAAAFAVGLLVLVLGSLAMGILYLIPGSDFVEGSLEGLTR